MEHRREFQPGVSLQSAGLRQNGALAGKSQIRMVIGVDGRVARSRLESTEIHDAEVSTCLVTQTRALRFTPMPRRRVEVGLTVDLNPGDAPLPDGALLVRPGRPEPPEDTCPGRIDVRAAMSALEPLIPRMTDCYAAGRAKDPLLWGRVTLRLDATEAGKIDRVA